ncbi:ABC transporter ATP-binding protein [Paenibacillus pedocola]|uniref:ABC transporter ATP-binding protein n=1 Tax=Paenibacillus pedocola TaxID=3242193 RepID=UPI002877E420|nr:ABC transporter ATP-binding protein [Paenibacillus typhae]
MLSENNAIEIKNISKKYYLYNSPADRMVSSLFKNWKKVNEVNALNNISINIPKGKTIGLIGQNGSGKSTLLQIITGILKATSGKIEVNGRIAALLELGSGFNPEFTGRENVYMNATILGLTKEEINDRFSDIEQFAEIGHFIDQPVKTYSSGMFLRLAFATAVHTDPDILIVDEALAVGDVRFQSKCFRKFKEFQERGKTILFVTHATELLIRHCDYAYLINQGELIQEGLPKEVVNTYLDLIYGKQKKLNDTVETPDARIQSRELDAEIQNKYSQETIEFITSENLDPNCENRRSYNQNEFRWGDKRAEIIDYLVLSNDMVDPVDCSSTELLQIIMKVKFNDNVTSPIYGLTIKTVDGVTVYGNNSRDDSIDVSSQNEANFCCVQFAFIPQLVEGDYFISLGIAEDVPGLEAPPLDRRYDLIHLKFHHDSLGFGIVDLGMKIEQLI